MTKPTASAAGLGIAETRIYYDAATGEVVHIHRLIMGAGHRLGDAQRDVVVEPFDSGIRQNYPGELAYLVVDEDDLRGDGRLLVDVASRRLVRRRRLVRPPAN